MSKPKLGSITWRQPVVFAAATLLCTVLAIWAVVAAPVGGVSGVSGLYLAAAVYVPLALWFGIWGCLAGYFSCIFMGLYLNFTGAASYSIEFLLVWSLADFFEGFVPLLIYRSIKTKAVLEFKRPTLTYTINLLLAVVLVVSAAALINSSTWIFLLAFAVSIILVLIQGFAEDKKTWLTWLPVGVLAASLASAFFGVGALALFGSIPLEAFSTVFFGWVMGDMMVLATLGTLLTVVFTPYIVNSKFYVRRFFS